MFSLLYSLWYCGVNTTVNNSNICTGANTSKLCSASLLHIFISLIVTGYCSPVIAPSDWQKVEDFKQPVCVEWSTANTLNQTFPRFTASLQWDGMSRDDVFRVLVHARTSSEAFCLFYWWTVYLHHDLFQLVRKTCVGGDPRELCVWRTSWPAESVCQILLWTFLAT